MEYTRQWKSANETLNAISQVLQVDVPLLDTVAAPMELLLQNKTAAIVIP